MRLCARTRPPSDLATSLVRTLCYAWTTTARFHNPVVPCHFCGLKGGDRQGHNLGGDAFRIWLSERAGMRDQPADEEMHAWLLRRVGSPNHTGIVALGAIGAFDARRRGSRSSARSLMDARLKEACRRHRRAREAFVAVHPVRQRALVGSARGCRACEVL